MNWNRIRDAFVRLFIFSGYKFYIEAALMRARYAGMMNNEMENKWDDRFNELRYLRLDQGCSNVGSNTPQLRRFHDPVKEAFLDLQCIPLRRTDVALSLIQFEVRNK